MYKLLSRWYHCTQVTYKDNEDREMGWVVGVHRREQGKKKSTGRGHRVSVSNLYRVTIQLGRKIWSERTEHTKRNAYAEGFSTMVEGFGFLMPAIGHPPFVLAPVLRAD